MWVVIFFTWAKPLFGYFSGFLMEISTFIYLLVVPRVTT